MSLKSARLKQISYVTDIHSQRMTVFGYTVHRFAPNTSCLYWHGLPLKETRARRRRNEQNRFSILQVGDPIRRATCIYDENLKHFPAGHSTVGTHVSGEVGRTGRNESTKAISALVTRLMLSSS